MYAKHWVIYTFYNRFRTDRPNKVAPVFVWKMADGRQLFLALLHTYMWLIH